VGDVRGAAARWKRVRTQPLERLAAVRLCELSSSCLSGPRAAPIYATDGLPAALAADVLLRHARALAFAGRPAEAARLILDRQPERLCAGGPSFCQRLVLALLHTPGASSEALALWAELPARDRGPDAREAEVAIADLAEAAGAPIFAANVLAAGAGRVPARELQEHLLRTAGLYLAGGDRVRAGVVLEFARARAGAKLSGERWAALARALAGQQGAPPRSDSVPPPERVPDAGELIAAANRAVRAAHSAPPGENQP
jgi:hypothetical protein